MTDKEYIKKREEYLEKIEYYKKKLLKLDEDFFEQLNKDNQHLKRIKNYLDEI